MVIVFAVIFQAGTSQRSRVLGVKLYICEHKDNVNMLVVEVNIQAWRWGEGSVWHCNQLLDRFLS